MRKEQQESIVPVQRKKKNKKWILYLLILLVTGLSVYTITNLNHQNKITKKAVKKIVKKKVDKIPTKTQMINSMKKTPLPTSTLIEVPEISQNPQLPNGCEVTSLAMLFAAIGHPENKLVLAKEEPFDPTPRVKNNLGQIIKWGNPNKGFVGSPYVWSKGFGIYHGPIIELINKILPGRGLDLTGDSFQEIEQIVAGGTPVEMWDTTTLQPTNSWVSWMSPEGKVTVTFYEHAVLLVGYNQNSVFINNPLNGKQAQQVPIAPFIAAWKQLGEQAVTITPKSFKST